MIENGYIKLYRSILDWEWYDDMPTKTLFLHLLLTVSIRSNQWHGIDVERGSRISSYDVLARETKLSVRQIRTAIKKLEKTGEVARCKYPKFTVFTVVNYDEYQASDREDDNVATSKRQGNDRQATSKRQQI